jgi:hypothetical protein
MKSFLVKLLALGTLWAITTPMLAQTLQFTNTCTPTVATNPVYLTVADVNGDGFPDLICASTPNVSFYQGALTVLTNDGTGVFGSNTTLLVNGNISSVCAPDINGDGKPDLVCYAANSSGSYLVIFTNNGAGIFASNAAIVLGSDYVYSVPSQLLMPIDVNGDGKMDLAVVSSGSLIANLIIFTNNGSGKLGAGATYALPRILQYMLVGDFNGDGLSDIIMGGLPDGDYRMFPEFLGSASGVLITNAPINSGHDPVALAAGDVNGDGKMDLVACDYHPSYYSPLFDIYTNAGKGTFNFVTNASSAGLGNPAWLTAADFNHDQRADLAAVYSYTNILILYTNNGSGSFTSDTTVHVGSSPIYVVTADLNGDHKPDVITVNQKDNTLSVLINTSVLSVPPLSIVNLGDQNALIWQANPGSFFLQTTTNLNSGTWTAVTNSTPLNCVGVTNQAPSAFYRLQIQ